MLQFRKRSETTVTDRSSRASSHGVFLLLLELAGNALDLTLTVLVSGEYCSEMNKVTVNIAGYPSGAKGSCGRPR